MPSGSSLYYIISDNLIGKVKGTFKKHISIVAVSLKYACSTYYPVVLVYYYDLHGKYIMKCPIKHKT